MKPSIAYTFIWLLCSLASYGQNELEFGDDNTFEHSLIAGRDIYYGLDSAQLHQLNLLNASIAKMNDQLAELAKQKNENQALRDTNTRKSQRIAALERQIAEDKRIRDSILNSIDKDSLVLAELNRYYDRAIDRELGRFWQQNPYINPESNKSWIQYAESQGVYVTDILNTGSSNYLKYQNCGGCVRESSGNDWLGVAVDGVQYFFNGAGTHTITGWQGKNIGSLSITIPGYGARTIFELREHYKKYNLLVQNRESAIDQQYARFLQNPKASVGEPVNPATPCSNNLGDLVVSNMLGQDVRVWLCNHSDSNCGEGSALYHLVIPAGGTATFFEVPEGVYNLNSKRGSGLVYPGPKGQVKILKCQEQTWVLQ